MREIRLTQNKFAIVDDTDFDLLNLFKWQLSSEGYATRRKLVGGKPQIISMHRFLLGLSKGDGLCVDHINLNKIDNRRINLRVCSKQQNAMNRDIHISNKSGYKGVCYHKRNKKYMASITKNKKKICIGYFSSAQEASEAYKKASIDIHGEYSIFNNSK
jgi:hypothetical protein